MDRDYHHPYDPYDIQRQFMAAVYECLEQGKVGIFESPTGTGKSLSLICGALTWLRDHKRSCLEENLNATTLDDDEPDWIQEHEKKRKQQVFLQGKLDLEARLKQLRQKEERTRLRYESGEPRQKRVKATTDDATDTHDNGDAAFMLDDYESDAEKTKVSTGLAELGLSAETRSLIDKLGGGVTSSTKDVTELEDETKIFFCSRTHSQLSQFVHELQRVRIPAAVPSLGSVAADNDTVGAFEEVKHITLGSRKTLCINDKVKRLGSVAAVNDRCLELQQTATPADAKCSFLPSKENEALVIDFRDHALARIRDIEDFGQLGKKLHVCPYYASRAAIKPAEIVTLPYPLLLQKAAREALNISLKGHVVIIDEAHNLMDAISNIYSVTLSGLQLSQARTQLVVYLQKFRGRLKGQNRAYITQLLRVLDSIQSFLETRVLSLGRSDDIVQVGDLLAGKGVDQINLYKLMTYLHESKLARKVDGYHASLEVAENHVGVAPKAVTKAKRSTVPVLSHVQSFLLALTNPIPEGQFFSSITDDGKALLKYLLLDPTQHFKEIVEEAHAVVLAGGTMSPMSDYTNNLFSYLPRERVQTLSCGHVIPSENLLATTVSKGPTGKDFEFTFDRRQSVEMLDELGRAIIHFSQGVPDGLVVFFPSYAYLDCAAERWKVAKASSSEADTIWSTFTRHKPVFMEPKSTTVPSPVPAGAAHGTAVDEVLAAYAQQVDIGRGALLFAVIGGSLSEGINFSDKLGRGIVVVGLPFPNANSPEWKARLNFIKNKQRQGSRAMDGDDSKEFYENACMRAVNQSIGRAIRHKGDYAVIALLDKRYDRPNIKSKLPGWIQNSLRLPGPFAQTDLAVRNFFRLKEPGGLSLS